MNQHFIYNTLNHVQYFINRGEKEASLNYIGRLSRLLRQWMRDASERAVSVADEMHLLQEYLTLEQMRFADRFSFEVATTVPACREIFITPHIIFPLAEHAVVWCLKQPAGGTIRICISPDDQLILCNIRAGNDDAVMETSVHLVPRHKNST